MSEQMSACREWQVWRDVYGYGQRRSDGKQIKVHRWVMETAGEDQFGTPWDPDLHVMHLCDNPPCFRFDHLRLGTHADNMADMVAKGRHAYGERGGRSKLKEADVIEIRRRLTSGETQATIARDFTVHQSTISLIRSEKRWRRVAAS